MTTRIKPSKTSQSVHIRHITANETIERHECPMLVTNQGATVSTTATLPDDAMGGEKVTLQAVAGFPLIADPGPYGTISVGAMTLGAGSTIQVSALNESVTLTATGFRKWSAVYNSRGDEASTLDIEEVDDDVMKKGLQNSYGSALLTYNGNQYCAFYSGQANNTITFGKRALPGGAWTFVNQAAKTLVNGVNDFHNWIALGVDKTGVIHCAYDMHIHGLKYFKFSAAESITTAGSNISMLGTNETQVTYAKFFNDKDGDLFFKFRDGPNSGNADWYLYKYNTVTPAWSAATGTGTGGLLVEGKPDDINGYTSDPYLDLANNVAHFSITWRDDSNFSTNHDLSYFSYNMTTGAVVQADGTAQTVPITLANAEIIDPVSTSSGLNNLTNQRSTARTGNGDVHVCYQKNDSAGNTQLWHMKHNGTSWSTPTQITRFPGNTPTNFQPQFLKDSLDVLYVLFKSSSGGYNANVLQSNDGGNTWQRYVLMNQPGEWVPRNVDLSRWDANDEYYQLMPFVIDEDYTNLIRSIYMVHWKPRGKPHTTRIVPSGIRGNDDYYIKIDNGRIRFETPSRMEFKAGDFDMEMPDDTNGVGLNIGNTDGWWKLFNATGNTNEFSPRMEARVKGSANSTFLDTEINDDTGTEPAMKIRVGLTNNNALANRDIIQIRNGSTEVLRINNDGQLQLPIFTDANRGSPPNGTVIINSDDNAINVRSGGAWYLGDGTAT